MKPPCIHRAGSSLCSASACSSARATGQAVARESSEGIRVQGPGVPSHIVFACCEHGQQQMQSLFAKPGLIGPLKDLNASVAIPTLDFSPQRADVVRLLNQQGGRAAGTVEPPFCTLQAGGTSIDGKPIVSRIALFLRRRNFPEHAG